MKNLVTIFSSQSLLLGTNVPNDILAATIVNKCYKNHAMVCTFKWKPLGRWSGTVEMPGRLSGIVEMHGRLSGTGRLHGNKLSGILG